MRTSGTKDIDKSYISENYFLAYLCIFYQHSTFGK